MRAIIASASRPMLRFLRAKTGLASPSLIGLLSTAGLWTATWATLRSSSHRYWAGGASRPSMPMRNSVQPGAEAGCLPIEALAEHGFLPTKQ